MTNATRETHDEDRMVGDDFEILSLQQREVGGGAWVVGKLNGHDFDALVFPEHAETSDYEIGTSRISKLSIRRLADREWVYSWDRGLDIAAKTPEAEAIVSFLAEGLATLIYGEEA